MKILKIVKPKKYRCGECWFGGDPEECGDHKRQFPCQPGQKYEGKIVVPATYTETQRYKKYLNKENPMPEKIKKKPDLKNLLTRDQATDLINLLDNTRKHGDTLCRFCRLDVCTWRCKIIMLQENGILKKE